MPIKFSSSYTLDSVARRFHHDCSSGFIDVKTTGEGFATLPLGTALPQLRDEDDLEGNGSWDNPFIVRAERAGVAGGGQQGAGGGVGAGAGAAAGSWQDVVEAWQRWCFKSQAPAFASAEGKPKVERWSAVHMAYCCVSLLIFHELYILVEATPLVAAILVDWLIFIAFLGPPDQWLLTVIFTEPLAFALAVLSVVGVFSWLGWQQRLKI